MIQYNILHLLIGGTLMFSEIFEFIEKKNIYSFAEFVSICIKYHKDWYNALYENESLRWMVKEFIESLRWENDKSYHRVDSILRENYGTYGYLEP